MVSDHIGQWSPPHPLNELKGKDYVLQSLCLAVFVNLMHLKVICLLLLPLLLMLVFDHCSAIDKSNVIRLGAMFHPFKHECCKLEVFCHEYRNLVPPVRFPHTN